MTNRVKLYATEYHLSQKLMFRIALSIWRHFKGKKIDVFTLFQFVNKRI